MIWWGDLNISMQWIFYYFVREFWIYTFLYIYFFITTFGRTWPLESNFLATNSSCCLFYREEESLMFLMSIWLRMRWRLDGRKARCSRWMICLRMMNGGRRALERERDEAPTTENNAWQNFNKTNLMSASLGILSQLVQPLIQLLITPPNFAMCCGSGNPAAVPTRPTREAIHSTTNPWDDVISLIPDPSSGWHPSREWDQWRSRSRPYRDTRTEPSRTHSKYSILVNNKDNHHEWTNTMFCDVISSVHRELVIAESLVEAWLFLNLVVLFVGGCGEGRGVDPGPLSSPAPQWAKLHRGSALPTPDVKSRAVSDLMSLMHGWTPKDRKLTRTVTPRPIPILTA